MTISVLGIQMNKQQLINAHKLENIKSEIRLILCNKRVEDTLFLLIWNIAISKKIDNAIYMTSMLENIKPRLLAEYEKFIVNYTI